MFSQSLETFSYGSPTIPLGYQPLFGTFSGATPRPTEHQLSPANNGTKMLNVEQIFMMYGTIPNPQPQDSQLPLGGQLQGSQLLPGAQPQGSQFSFGGPPQCFQPSGQYIPQVQPHIP